jgi:hypothetical protein
MTGSPPSKPPLAAYEEDGTTNTMRQSTSLHSINTRPNSRGINFSRPTTMYKLDSPTSPLRQGSESSEDGDMNGFYSPTTSPNPINTNSSPASQGIGPSTQPYGPRKSSLSHSVKGQQQQQQQQPQPKKPNKICQKCGQGISGQFVRALNAAYHIECFACADCGKLCSSKFFPIEAPPNIQEEQGVSQIPLCEKDYFRRLGLLCYVCDGALRGSYITALGRKYHVEHFTCSLCDTVFGPEDSYYEYQDQIYCHFHYSTMYASKCEGCQTAILKQFVEIFRGGREQQWHPECYMIFKFWNVKLCPDGTPQTLNPLRPLSRTASAPLESLTQKEVARHEAEMDQNVFRIWTVLCGYEEATASYISDMLQTASSGKFSEALKATTKLVNKVEVLFNAINELCVVIDPIIRQESSQEMELTYTKLGKEAKTLCKKIVGFMSLVSKAREKSMKRMGITQELLNLVTSLAHYLKLLIRYGLSNSLAYDRQNLDGNMVDKLLERVSIHESDGKTSSTSSNASQINVNAMTSDHCYVCDKSVEDMCIKIGERRWHVECFKCGHCQRSLGRSSTDRCDIEDAVSEARWSNSHKQVFCSLCSPEDSKAGFVVIPKLHQFVFLLRIAVARLQLVLNAFDARDKKSKKPPQSTSSPSQVASQTPQQQSMVSKSSSDVSQNERGYMTTLTDIRRLRSTKLDQQVSESARRARRSRILDMPESEEGHMSKNDSTPSLSLQTPQTQPPQGQASIPEPSKSPPLLDTSTDTPQLEPTTSATKPTVPPPSGKKKKRQLKIEDEVQREPKSRLDRTTDLFKNETSLTLDDIPRIVAAEQAREQRPNAFRHQARDTKPSNSVPQPKSVSEVGKKDVQQHHKKYISELTPVELFSVRHIAVLLLEQTLSDYFTQEELFDFIEVKKNPTIWEKFGKAFGNDKQRKPKKVTGVFGVPLDQLVEKYGVESTLGVGPAALKIPAFIDDCVSSMRQKDMSVEGVFRKNGNIRRLKEFTEKIDKNPDKSGLLTEEGPVQLAALLKKFLRELPEPLMTTKLLKLWITAQSKLNNDILLSTHKTNLDFFLEFDDIEMRKRILHLTCLLLPKTHRDTMEVLFFFLNWTASFSHIDEETGSKMDAHNLATVITPNILYIKQTNGNSGSSGGSTNPNVEQGDAYFLSIESVNTLIEEQSQMAEVPQEVLSILHHTNLQSATSELTTKEIITRFEQYLKDDDAQAAVRAQKNASSPNANAGSGTPSPLPPGSGKNTSRSAAVRTSTMADVETMSTSGSRPAPIRVDTELAQRMAQDHEMQTSIKRVHSPSVNSPSNLSTSSPNLVEEVVERS